MEIRIEVSDEGSDVTVGGMETTGADRAADERAEGPDLMDAVPAPDQFRPGDGEPGGDDGSASRTIGAAAGDGLEEALRDAIPAPQAFRDSSATGASQ